MSETGTRLDQEAEAILRGNDLGGYTVPTKGLYPFQWNWDSCLVALGWAAIDEARAWTEIRSLFEAQWPDGMVPHIVFHREDPGYFPGPERWGTGRQPMTSGITQPPVAASCVRRILDRAREKALAEEQARILFPKLFAYHRWFHTVRDPQGIGIVTTLHPWETGMDNSPAWDEALMRVEVAGSLEPYTRRDTQHVDPSMRPTKAEYDRYMTLVELYRSHGWRHEITTLSPFRVADVGTNCILLRADRDLLAMAERFGEVAAAEQIAAWIRSAERSFNAFREINTGLPRSFDQMVEARIPALTHAGFLAFWAGVGHGDLAVLLEQWLDASAFGVASVLPGDPRFEARRYWRGPVWLVVNFMIAEGLRESGHGALADRIRDTSRRLVEAEGFHEYFDPLDGTGLGGDAFTWTAAMWLAWAGAPA